jgi:hypothetical protein
MGVREAILPPPFLHRGEEGGVALNNIPKRATSDSWAVEGGKGY